jgi:pimeloyl-ACP methyl ester carboxylesterase
VAFQARLTRTVSLNYLLYLPGDYQASGAKHWPMILFLHGAGERGADLDLVAKHGPPKLVAQKQEFPFVIVSPQCPAGQRWDDEALVALLDHVLAKYKVDTTRIYLTGLSMGGYGTWSLAVNHPERFAAAAPILRRRRWDRRAAGGGEQTAGAPIAADLGVPRGQRPGRAGPGIGTDDGRTQQSRLHQRATDGLPGDGARCLHPDLQQPQTLRVVPGASAKIGGFTGSVMMITPAGMIPAARNTRAGSSVSKASLPARGSVSRRRPGYHTGF